MPQARAIPSSFSPCPFLVSFLQASLEGRAPASAYEFLHTLYDIAHALPQTVQGAEHAVSLLDESVLASNLSLSALVAKLHSRGDRHQSLQLFCRTKLPHPCTGVEAYNNFLASVICKACQINPKETVKAISHSQFQQPWQALSAKTDARGRNYSVRNLKRKRLSGSSAE